MMIRNTFELKEKLKKGTISYFDLSQQEIVNVKKALQEEIKNNKQNIQKIKEKVKLEKIKIENLKKQNSNT